MKGWDSGYRPNVASLVCGREFTVPTPALTTSFDFVIKIRRGIFTWFGPWRCSRVLGRRKNDKTREKEVHSQILKRLSGSTSRLGTLVGSGRKYGVKVYIG